LISPEKYEELTEQLEDYALYIEAEKRMKNVNKDDFIPECVIMKELGITEKDLEECEVEID
ncbi:MAG TPA: prevent-host-death protein, partial [Clostridiales bacterium]|nr:prevent-host-death protein [Clostridiales bacterium]